MGTILPGRKAVLSAVVLILAGATSAHAASVPVLGAPLLVKNDGNVIATYIYSENGFPATLYLDEPTNSLGGLFSPNHCYQSGGSCGSPDGLTVDLGYFTAGTELIFRLEALDDPGDGFPSYTYNWFTGSASRNSDGLDHAYALADSAFPDLVFVGMEDSPFLGDANFADMQFSLTNVMFVPVPAALPLLVSAFGVLIPFARRLSRPVTASRL